MQNRQFTLHISDNRDALAADATDLLQTVARESIERRGQFNLALSGGSTPKLLYRYIVTHASDLIDWSRVYFFWSDERFVPISHADSNGGLAKRELLDPLDIHRDHIFYVPTEFESPARGAREYEEVIRRHVRQQGASAPSFDLILLGLGNDGHTASLFPNSRALQEERRLVVENWVEKLAAWRITFTYQLINAAQHVLFLISGQNKADIARQVIQDRRPYPATAVQPQGGRLHYYLDKAAAILFEKGEIENGSNI